MVFGWVVGLLTLLNQYHFGPKRKPLHFQRLSWYRSEWRGPLWFAWYWLALWFSRFAPKSILASQRWTPKLSTGTALPGHWRAAGKRLWRTGLANATKQATSWAWVSARLSSTAPRGVCSKCKRPQCVAVSTYSVTMLTASSISASLLYLYCLSVYHVKKFFLLIKIIGCNYYNKVWNKSVNNTQQTFI